MPTRRLANSGISRLKALQTAKERKDSIPPPAVIPFTAATIIRIDTVYPAFKTNIEAMEAALQAQSAATTQVKATRPDAEMLISHFYQALQNAIARKVFEPSVRAFYGLAVSDGTVPSLKSEADISFWGDKAVTGEAARIAAGGTAIPFPTIAEVSAKVNPFKAANQTQANAKEAYDNAQEAVETDTIEVDKLILKMWNEIEAAFDEGNKPSMRRKAREWGVVYTISSGEVLNPDEFSIAGTLTNIETGQPIENAAVIVQAAVEIIVLTDAQGKYYVPKLPVGNYNMVAHKDGFEDWAIPGVAVAEDAVTMLDIELTPVSTGGVSGTVLKAGVGILATVAVEGTAISVQTDGTGHYLVEGIEPGTVNVRATSNANPSDTLVLPAFVSAGGIIELIFNLS